MAMNHAAGDIIDVKAFRRLFRTNSLFRKRENRTARYDEEAA
jgi:hypothetical protein